MRQQWCIEKISGTESWRYLRMSGVKNGLHAFSRVAECDDIRSKCKGHLHVCFSPREYYLYNDAFPEVKQELLDLQINKRFSDRGLTMDVGHFVHRAAKISGKPGWLNCLFAPQAEVAELYAFIQPWQKIHSCRLFSRATAVASLIQQLTDEAVLVFLLGNGDNQVLVVKGGTPLYNQSLNLREPGVIDEALIPHAIDFARTVVRKDYAIEDLHIICMGSGRGGIHLENLGIEEWQPNFKQVFQLESDEEVLLYPQLFGAAFVDKSYDFLPQEFATAWRLQAVSLRTSILAAAAGIALLGGWLYLQPQITEQRAQYQALSTAITRQQEDLGKRIPANATLETFDRLKNIRNRAIADFHLDTLAEKLALALPDTVHVTSLQVKRQPGGGGASVEPTTPETADFISPETLPGDETANTALSVPEQLQSQNPIITASCMTNGSYGEVNARFENVIIALNRLFKVSKMSWSYQEADKTGQLNCELFPKSEVAKL